jgi:hypothetical protein
VLGSWSSVKSKWDGRLEVYGALPSRARESKACEGEELKRQSCPSEEAARALSACSSAQAGSICDTHNGGLRASELRVSQEMTIQELLAQEKISADRRLTGCWLERPRSCDRRRSEGREGKEGSGRASAAFGPAKGDRGAADAQRRSNNSSSSAPGDLEEGVQRPSEVTYRTSTMRGSKDVQDEIDVCS